MPELDQSAYDPATASSVIVTVRDGYSDDAQDRMQPSKKKNRPVGHLAFMSPFEHTGSTMNVDETSKFLIKFRGFNLPCSIARTLKSLLRSFQSVRCAIDNLFTKARVY